jgi:hypothetical protein
MIATLKRVTAAGLGVGDPYNFKKSLPDWAGPTQLRWSGTDEFGRETAWDVTWDLPWGGFGDVGKGQLGKNMAQIGLAFPQWMEPGNPWLTSTVASITGKDSFTGKRIVSPGAPIVERIAQVTAFQARLWGPTLFNPASSGWERARRAVTADLGDDPHVQTPGEWLASDVLGWKNRPFDRLESWRWRARAVRDELNEARAEILSMKARGAPSWQIDQRREQARLLVRQFQEKFGPAPEPNPLFERAIKASRERLGKKPPEDPNFLQESLGLAP